MVSGAEQDGPPELPDQPLTDLSGRSFESHKSLHPKKASCTVNNIYIIGDINASDVKLGESSFENVSSTTKKHCPSESCASTTQSNCDLDDARSPVSHMPEYFDKTKSSENPIIAGMISNDHVDVEHTTDNHVRATCHCHSVTKQ